MDLQIELPPMDESWFEMLTLYPQLAIGTPNTILYEPCGPIGLSESLLYYDETGTLRGILNHFPNDGNLNVFVDPSRQRRGIGTKLLNEAMKRWMLNFERQMYSGKGAALVKAVLNRKF